MNDEKHIPEITVIGGGLRGIAAARSAAQSGAKVYLIEPRQYLGHELTATGHNWLVSGGIETALQNGAIKKMLLGEVTSDGITPLFASYAGGIALAEKSCAGVIVCNSWGVHLLKTDAVIDTEGNLFSEPFEETKNVSVHYSFTLSDVETPFFKKTKVEHSLNVEDDLITLHRDLRPGCYSVEFAFSAEVDYLTFCSPQRLLLQAQRKAQALWQWLRKNTSAFSHSVLHRMMFHEVRLTGYNPKQRKLPNGVCVISDMLSADFTAQDIELLKRKISSKVNSFILSLTPAKQPDLLCIGEDTLLVSDCGAQTDEAPFSAKLTIPNGFLKENGEYRVILAGAGTTGTQVMRALNEKGIPFAVVEANALPGGTKNLGLVVGYWHGYTDGLNKLIDSETINYASSYTQNPSKFDIPAALMQINHSLKDVEKDCFWLTFVCGAEKSGDRVERLQLCDGHGLFALKSKIVIDATGDGTVAYLAGADYEVGDFRDGSVQSCSLWGENINSDGNFLNNPYNGDIDICDPDSYADTVRLMMLGVKQASDYDNSPMLSVRESRRIIGDYQLNIEDIWNEVPFEDTVAVTLTPFDTHGNGSTIFSCCGLNSNSETEFRARIPYRSYLVKGFSNILITAKAFSATRDASIVCRMNADLRHAGYAVGLCAAQAVKSGCELRKIDVKKVQNELLQKNCLPEWTFETQNEKTYEILLCEAKNGSKDAIRKLCLSSNKVGQKIINEYNSHNKNNAVDLSKQADCCYKDVLTFLAAWFGDENALMSLSNALAIRLKTHCTSFDDDYYDVCRSLSAFVKAKTVKPSMLIPLIEFADAGGEVTYAYNPKYINRIYGFNRVDCWKLPSHMLLNLIAQAVERHADSLLLKSMERLLEKENVCGYLTVRGKYNSTSSCYELAPAFCSLLEARLTAAAARCGSHKALLHLADFTNEERSLLRKFASKELAALTDVSADNSDGWKNIINGIAKPKILPYDGELVIR